MASERGWWKITYTVEAEDFDLEHIASLVREGYREGEIVKTEAAGKVA